MRAQHLEIRLFASVLPSTADKLQARGSQRGYVTISTVTKLSVLFDLDSKSQCFKTGLRNGIKKYLVKNNTFYYAVVCVFFFLLCVLVLDS